MSTSQAVISYCNWLCCMMFENKAILEGNIKGSINKKLSSHVADLDIFMMDLLRKMFGDDKIFFKITLSEEKLKYDN